MKEIRHKITLKNIDWQNARELDSNEMKHIFGGSGAGWIPCPTDTKLHHCISGWIDNLPGEGYICAMSPEDAAGQLKEYMNNLGIGQGYEVSCKEVPNE